MKKLIATVLAGLVLASSFGSVNTYAAIKDKKVIQYIDKETKGEAKKTNYWYDEKSELNLFPTNKQCADIKTFKIAKNFWNGNINLARYIMDREIEPIWDKDGKVTYSDYVSNEGFKINKGWAIIGSPVSAFYGVTTKVKVKDVSVAEVKVVNLGNRKLNIIIKPKKIGKTKVSVTYSKDGFLDYTFTTNIEVTKDGWWGNIKYTTPTADISKMSLRTFISANGSIGAYTTGINPVMYSYDLDSSPAVNKEYEKNFDKMILEVLAMEAETDFNVIENLAEWLNTNIKYDYAGYDNYKDPEKREKRNYELAAADIVLKNREASYVGFSSLFADVMDSLGFYCNTKRSSKNQWNYFTYMGDIYEADPTIGYVYSEGYNIFK